jgi:hypothetical protein
MWKRFSDGGDLMTGVLYGLVIAFNWMWLEGFYNFTLGLAGYALALGFLAKWDRLDLARTSLLAMLAVLVYFSHQMCFGALAFSVLLMAGLSASKGRWRNIALSVAALLPAVVLLVVYVYTRSGHSAGALEWSNLKSGSVTGWLTQLRTANPFMIVLTRNLPFSKASSYAPIFAPVVWIFAAIVCLFLGKRSVAANDERVVAARRWRPIFAALLFIFIAGALFAPDALAGGSVIRPRMTLFASIALVPLIVGSAKGIFRNVATVTLAVVFAFQCVAMWDYALTTSADAGELLAAADNVEDGQGIAAVTVTPSVLRYPTDPLIHVDGFMTGTRSVVAWDVYETSLMSFPVIARSDEDRAFISRLNNDSVIDRADPDAIVRLARDLDEGHDRIVMLAVWNGDESVRDALEKWYEPVPARSQGRAEIFRRRP